SGSGGDTSATTASTTGSGSCTPAVECEPEPLPSTGDPHQDCVDRVNQFRVGCWCLPALERWTEGEACANEHAQYDSEADEAHAGFGDGICENGGNAQNECPGWNSEAQIIEGCLQMMYDEGPPPSEQCNGQCFQDHGHFINMTNERYSRVACGFYTTPGGDVWSVQNFR
ncbi:MAG TPA: CAP domain-containing protein, partial [Polyangiaceae bacterium]